MFESLMLNKRITSLIELINLLFFIKFYTNGFQIME